MLNLACFLEEWNHRMPAKMYYLMSSISQRFSKQKGLFGASLLDDGRNKHLDV